MKGKTVLTAWIIFVAVSLFVAVHFSVVWEPKATYDVRKSVAWLKQARSTNNIYKMKDYLLSAIREIEDKTGNPCWWFETAKTDFDEIKEAIRKSIAQLENLTSNPDSFAIQQFIHNMGEYTIPELIDRLKSTKFWITYHEGAGPVALEYLLLIPWVIIVVLLIIATGIVLEL